MNWLKAAVFGVVTVVMAIGAVVTAVGRTEFLRSSARAPGVVSKLNAGGSHPQVSFTVAGLEMSFAQGGWIWGYEVGDQVTVLYDPENPHMTATIDSTGALWFATSFFAFMTLGFGFGTLVLVREARNVA